MTFQGTYEVHITDQGPAAQPFGWAILQRQDRRLLARSTRTFATPGEAIADAAQARVWQTPTDKPTSEQSA